MRRLSWFAVGLTVLALLLILFHTPILTGMARYLDQSGPPQKAEAVFVLAGDSYGKRILKGAELVREGWAPEAIISGPAGTYGFYECDLAIPFAVKAGYPESYFVRFPHSARSTQEEAAAAAAEFKALHLHRVILVTSLYHTRRAGADFRAASPDVDFFVVSSPDQYFTADGWWRSREARKEFLMEWTKTVATWAHL